VGGHPKTSLYGHGQDIGQVILALGVLVSEGLDPGPKQRRRGHEDPGVHFLNEALFIAGIFFLDAASQVTIGVSQDPSVASGVDESCGQESNPVVAEGEIEKAAEGLSSQERYVSIKDDGMTLLWERGHGAGDSMPRALRRVLYGKAQ
jgi:hypothetical protein